MAIYKNNNLSPAPIYVVEDDNVLRESLVTLLEKMHYHVYAFESAVQFLGYYKVQGNLTRGCLILDVRLPNMSGLELQSLLAIDACLLPIIFVTAHADVPMAIQALENGAFGFLTKPYKSEELVAKLNDALEVSEKRYQQFFEKNAFTSLLASLSKKEMEVLPFIISGKTSKFVGNELNISDRTVEVHRANIFKKLHANSLAELVSKYTLYS